MLLPHLITLLPLAGIVAGLPSNAQVRSDLKLKESHAVPKGWTKGARAARDHMVNLQIGLKQGNTERLDNIFAEVSDPTHKNYGKYLSASEVQKLVAPSQTTIDLVHEWLNGHGVNPDAITFSASRDWAHISLPVEKVEELLGSSYSEYRHSDGSKVIRSPEWSLPEHLHEHIDVVQPTTSFFRLNSGNVGFEDEEHGLDAWQKHVKDKRPSHGQHNVTAVCNATAVTLECLRTVYNTIDYVPQAAVQNGIGITNYLGETSRRDDLKTFLNKFRPEAAYVADEFPIVIINNGSTDQGPLTPDQLKHQLDGEANLDTQTVIGVSFPTNFTAWTIGGEPDEFTPDKHESDNGNEPYLVWLNYVLNQTSLPQVVSTSYGDDEQTVPYSYAKRACDSFKQLGVRGVSVIFSSGDSGVGADGTCISNTDNTTSEFIPAFPASCPWVTAVGATANFEPETAVSRFASGAGFSNYFKQPHYQHHAVSGYLNTIGDLHSGLYNATGRGYPDVAAQGNAPVIVYNGKLIRSGGTSASAPLFAAIIALVNDALLAKGKPVLGFLNPWLYGHAHKTFTDVTIGSSFGCDTDGFPAEKGWDAVTGFGTPDFKKLLHAAGAQ